ncbi:MAG: lipoyl synthase [Pseudomonadales bacterium]|jgi:lipoic acid synthetase|nr:lipoyl synthase [Pseudomonadales bacterium]MDP7597644.1 lipoyl synthase [Pseudomonadales bacterium]HJL53904.1 lipoyl synthase [Arenicellales bacterium]HJN53084.1 lipoyl synthase [Pseudomonadales bacterium]
MNRERKPKPRRVQQGEKLRGADKLARIPLRDDLAAETARKPDWIRVRIPASPQISRIKRILRRQKLATVCEEASCPNLGECFSHGTATFLIMGDICTRRCPFCDVAHGRPNPLDAEEPVQLAAAIAEMKLNYVVVTSVDRDDLPDGGAGHFAECIRQIRKRTAGIEIEVLVPDFKGKMQIAIEILAEQPADVFNHNLETVPRLYKKVRPGADYQWSLDLLQQYKKRLPIRTKSGLMLGLGESIDEVQEVMADLRRHQVDMLTLGQYLQPSKHHLNVTRFVHPSEFSALADFGRDLGFSHVASGPLVRSSYHADLQLKGEFPTQA